MSPYELADLSQSFFGNALSTYAVFLSIVSGFLATAYLAGAKLSTFQIRLLTTLFSLVSLFLIWTMSSYVYWGVMLALNVADGPSDIMLPGIWVPVVFTVLNLFTGAACLLFMGNVRKQK